MCFPSYASHVLNRLLWILLRTEVSNLYLSAQSPSQKSDLELKWSLTQPNVAN